MTLLNDRKYVKEQYRNSGNLEARASLHQRFSANKYGWQPWVFDQIDLPERCRVLELGCGPGYLWKENIERIPAGWDITLSDSSQGMLDAAWQNLEKLRPFQYKLIDAQAIPYGNGEFDAVIANHMLYHVPDRQAALKEIHRVLNSSGCLYAATGGENHMSEIDGLIKSFDPKLKGWSQARNPFTMENGAEQLEAWFAEVRAKRYEDHLEVTDADALSAYILSTTVKEQLKGQEEPFCKFVTRTMKSNGGMIRIRTEGGLFVCRSGKSKA